MVRVIADVHEKSSGVPRLLEEMGIKVKLEKLTVADYIVGESVAIERKSARDYIGSLFRGRLFEQAGRLREAYDKAVIVVEGELFPSLENERAIWGSIFSLSVDQNIAVLQSKDRGHTAEAIFSLARREQEDRGSVPRIRPKPRMLELHERQLFLVAGLTSVGEGLAEKLLEHFHTPRRVFSATKKELMQVPGIGEKKAREIIKVLESEYSLRQGKL